MNPLSPIEICNAALIYVGSGLSIDSFEAQDPAARACRIEFPQSRREFLDNDHPFTFATTRTALASIADVPGAYQLPTDMIRPVALAGDGDRMDFYIEQDRLYTSQSGPVLIYVRDSPDMAWYPPKAVTAIKFILASKLAVILKQDGENASRLQRLSMDLVSELIASDIGNLELPEIPPYESSFYSVR